MAICQRSAQWFVAICQRFGQWSMAICQQWSMIICQQWSSPNICTVTFGNLPNIYSVIYGDSPQIKRHWTFPTFIPQTIIHVSIIIPIDWRLILFFLSADVQRAVWGRSLFEHPSLDRGCRMLFPFSRLRSSGQIQGIWGVGRLQKMSRKMSLLLSVPFYISLFS